MSVGVGLRVGTTVSSVAVTSPSPGRPDPAPIERRTAVHLHADGTATLGDHDGADGNTSSFVDFVDRLGRSTGVRANDGSLSRAEDLVATAMECLLADAMTLVGSERYTAVATHPTEWPPSTVAVLRNALDYVGLRHVSLISDAEAAAAWFESQVAHQTGRLVAVYHIDPYGTTVTLVRSGVTAGKSFRFPEGEAPSVTAQLSAALGAFGWLVSNLDAVVVTTDEAMDPGAAQLVTQSIKSGLGVRCALAPDPHQTMVRGAALAAAAGSVDLLGSTQILPVAKIAAATPRNQFDPEATTVIAKITTTPPAAQATSQAVSPPPPEEKEEDSGKRRSPLFAAGAAAAAIALLVAVGVLVLTLRDSSTASAGTPASSTTIAPFSDDRPSSTKPVPSTTTTPASSTTDTTAAPETTTYVPVAPVVPQQTWIDPATSSSSSSRSSSSGTTDSGPSSTGSTTTTTTTEWSRRNPPRTPSDSGGGQPTESTTTKSPQPTSTTEPTEPTEPTPDLPEDPPSDEGPE